MQHLMVVAWVIVMAIIISSMRNKPAKPEWDPIAQPGLVIRQSPLKDSTQQKHQLFVSKSTALFLVKP